jgi:hypothetical protein
MERRISVCIPQYGRPDMLMETIQYPLFDSRIDEIIICDDQSPIDEYYKLIRNIKGLPKIKLIKNVVNFHNQQNKRNALSFAKNDWCVLLDNDNKINKDFIDKLYEIENWAVEKIYHPAFAAPNFDYRKFNNHTIDIENVAKYCDYNIFMTLLNTNNYFVNRNEYLKTYQYNSEIRGADGIYNNFNWLKAGNTIYIVPNMEYEHRVHPGSEFLHERDSNMIKINYWLNQVKQLK